MDTTTAENLYCYKVKMTCGGCSGAVTRVLQKAKNETDSGVSDFVVDLKSQFVLVSGKIEQEQLTEKIKKTGKEILNEEDMSGNKKDFEKLFTELCEQQSS